ncbi:M20/M25/M40 family metallo-hydrolase [Microbacterium hominis]|uniref:M20/M25/M40 family metallo-hydrolase n=1 Tax=Microbacterium hominis TaxID=162426 RepID=A0A7D4Q739_9MICO|nr:M20/M25/M40 family metallo-hydrolase [Microbacterium hominis]QKJ18699.1 M20/M25/M40 family metallo-hydrolase [Microbacterium hominis]
MYRSALLSRRVAAITAAAAAAAALTLGSAGAATAAPASAGCDNRVNNTYEKLLECVRLDGVLEHEEAFQAIADANGGNRAAGLPGYTDSAEYVAETLRAAGWNVTTNEFPFTFVPPAQLTQTAPVTATYETGTFTGTGFGTVSASVESVDLALAPPRASTSGCEPADFAGFTPGNIALVQRGTCSFGIKAVNAQAAGATAVIIFNQGNTPDREGLIIGTLLPDGATVTIPVVGASFADGVALSQPGSMATIQVDAPEQRPQVNVIAELPGKNDDNVVMAGAHLDSVQRGPGINDNGSGSAALLEIAQQIAKLEPQNTLRFAWWGAEESGLLGSNAYVNGLPQEEKDRIALYLNFDMVASPNYIFMVYDGDESSFPAPVVVPEGSIQIEDVFESYFTKRGIPYEDAEFSGRSDYQAFILNGIPAGGLFTGAEVVKTPEQQEIWGGTAGAQFDPCYHLACDTIDNLSHEALDVNSDAIATAVLTFAYSTESVNGVVGKKVPGGFTFPAPAGPEGTFAGGGGGHDHSHGDDID